MSSRTPGPMGFDFTFGSANAGASSPRPIPDAPFRIAVLADLSARDSRAAADPATLATRRPRRVDIDNLDQTIAACGVTIRVVAPDPIDIPISSLDDFHPDHLYRTLDLFADLRDLRARLLNPETFPAAAEQALAQLGSINAPPSSSPAPAPAADAPAPNASSSGANLLESLLGGAVKRTPAPSTPSPSAPSSDRPDVASIVRRMIQASQTDAVAKPDPQRDTYLAAVDDAIAQRLRAILHHPDFQRAEAAWRAVHFLITSIQTDEDLTIDLFDVSRAELAADLRASATGQGGSLADSGLAKLLMNTSTGAPGGHPWSLIVADLALDFTTPDAALAAYLAGIAARVGAPIVAAATPAHVGCPSFAGSPDPDSWTIRPPAGDDAAPAAWGAVRQMPEADRLALVMPRFLARLPYGPGGETVESFAFREIPAPDADHDRFLWANPAFAAAVIIAQAFTDDGAEMTLPGAGEITGLPLHTYTDAHGEKTATPCAEAWLTLKASHLIQSAGFSPLLSIKGRDAARLATIQSIANPLTPLAGRWN